jgi:hypothetical protein
MIDAAPSARQRLVIGALFAGVGLFVVLVGAGVTAVKPEPGDAPPWVIACAGLVFLLAGVSVLIGALSSRAAPDGTLPDDAPFVLRLCQYLCGVTLAAMLATVGSFAAFGPGERHFTSSVPFLSGELAGRIAFGVGAVMVWALTGVFAVVGARRLRPNVKQRQA